MIGRWSAAAAVILCIYFVVQGRIETDDWLVYETGYGEKLDLVLEDGTAVSLNANSKLSWNKSWRKKSLRQVDLEGEAFFDVSHLDRQGRSLELQPKDKKRKKMPFEVYTSDLTIQVLGTTFNASDRRGKTEIFLESGSVVLSLKKTSTGPSSQSNSLRKKDQYQIDEMIGQNSSSNEHGANVVYMEPGDFVQYTRGKSFLVEKSDLGMDNHLEWKEGTLSYRDVEFRSMLQNLEDIYGKTFLVEDENLLSTRVEFGVPYEDWETVTQMMEWMLKIDIEEIGNNQIRIKKRKGN
nr:FecR family protein [Membranihabitans marinus]